MAQKRCVNYVVQRVKNHADDSRNRKLQQQFTYTLSAYAVGTLFHDVRFYLLYLCVLL